MGTIGLLGFITLPGLGFAWYFMACDYGVPISVWMQLLLGINIAVVIIAIPIGIPWTCIMAKTCDNMFDENDAGPQNIYGL